MSSDLDPLLKRLHLANARRAWRELVQRAEKEDWSYETLLLTLFSEEVAHRRGTRLTRAVSAAAFPFLRTIEEFDFTHQSTLRLTTFGSLLTPDFVTEGRSLILEGKPGRGKTHLAIAIAYRALQNGFDALFTTAAELIDDLSVASRGGGLREALATYMKPHVLVVDEVGYLPYGDDAASALYHVVNDRHIRRRAMVFTTNKHPKRWGDVLHDDDLAEAIVDRVLERGRLLRLDGPSMRTKHLSAEELGTEEYTQQEPARVSGKERPEFPERTSGNARAKEQRLHGHAKRDQKGARFVLAADVDIHTLACSARRGQESAVPGTFRGETENATAAVLVVGARETEYDGAKRSSVERRGLRARLHHSDRRSAALGLVRIVCTPTQHLHGGCRCLHRGEGARVALVKLLLVVHHFFVPSFLSRGKENRQIGFTNLPASPCLAGPRPAESRYLDPMRPAGEKPARNLAPPLLHKQVDSGGIRSTQVKSTARAAVAESKPFRRFHSNRR